ncbi:MAG: hypothetical protein M5U28_34880 [Sandaracinaceae bacterium]|nr:hypothetical protein [Sandaracinaceae bacterium]
MDVLSWLAGCALLFSVGVAGGSLLTAFRSSAARTASRGAWLCLGALGVLVVLGVGGYLLGLSIAFGAVAHAEPSVKASLLAQGISEATNCAAFVAFGTLPVLVSAVVLLLRASRLRALGARAARG